MYFQHANRCSPESMVSTFGVIYGDKVSGRNNNLISLAGVLHSTISPDSHVYSRYGLKLNYGNKYMSIFYSAVA